MSDPASPADRLQPLAWPLFDGLTLAGESEIGFGRRTPKGGIRMHRVLLFGRSI